VSYYDGYTRGHVKATMKANAQVLADLEVDADQKGWGVNPILGLDYHWKNLTLGAKYEFRTKLNIPCSTSTLKDADGALAAYADGEKIRYDMPALLSVAAGYAFADNIRATLEYHFFDDKHAKMANDRQEKLTHGTHEFLAGVEGDINDRWTLSCGMQRTDYGLSDDYQQNTSFACDSWSFGMGCAVNITKQLRLNAGYFLSIYDDYTKECNAARDGYNGREGYSRTNHVIGLGIDYKF
jgi:long-chain fatty acid transport protein